MPVAHLVPTAAELPDVLPTDRLSRGGRIAGAARSELRAVPAWRSATTVTLAWTQIAAVLGIAIWSENAILWILAVVFMGRSFGLLAILAHEAAHRLLFSNPAVNDFVGRYLLGYPAFVAFDQYRKVHLAHHKDEMGPDEPDLALYAGYPITAASWRRKLTRDAFFNSGWKNLLPLLRALRSTTARPVALRILLVQVMLAIVLTVLGGPLAYPVLWLVPWLTVWRVLNRLRAVAEHGGMIRSTDRRQTTHHVQQSPLARFWIAPYMTGWHLAHHVDIGIPFRNLPALHRELEDAGWITPALTYPNYRTLWKALRSATPTPTTDEQ